MGQFPAQGGAPGQGGGAGGGGHVIENEGSPLIQQSVLNFVGQGVTASDVGGKTEVSIPGFTSGDAVIGNQQIFFPASCMYADPIKPTLQLQTKAIGTFSQIIQYIEFPRGDGSADADSLAYFDWFTPNNWASVPAIIGAIAFWTTDQAPGNTQIDLQIAILAKRDAEAIGNELFPNPGAWQDIQAGTDTLNHDKAGGGPTVGSNPLKQDWLQFELRRDVNNDQNPGNIQLIGIKIQYVTDSGTA